MGCHLPYCIGTIGCMTTLTDTTYLDILADRSIHTVGLLRAADILGISRTAAYGAARRGYLTDGVPVIRVGGRYAVSTTALRRVLGIE